MDLLGRKRPADSEFEILHLNVYPRPSLPAAAAMDSDWDEEVTSDLHAGDAEWIKMSSEFINVRGLSTEFITAA